MTIDPIENVARGYRSLKDENEKLRQLILNIYIGPAAYLGEKLKNDNDTKKAITKLLDVLLDAGEGRPFDPDVIIPFHPTIDDAPGDTTSPRIAKMAGQFLNMSLADFTRVYGEGLEPLHEDIKSMAASLINQAPDKKKRTAKKTTRNG